MALLDVVLWCLVILQGYSFRGAECASSDSCAGKVCPPTLECTFPNTQVVLTQPDACCPKTVCVCKGTKTRTSSHANAVDHYKDLEQRYTNCSLVNGNLELAIINPLGGKEIKPIEFTKHIEQVTGYVLISRVTVDYIDLSSLRLIRGIEKYVVSNKASQHCPNKPGEHQGAPTKQYALYVEHCDDKSKHYLRELRMQNLTEIIDGDVGFVNNSLCNMDKILWNEEIFSLTNKQKFEDHNFKGLRPCWKCTCPAVKTSTGSVPNVSCWGNSTSLCQRITKSNCLGCGASRCNSNKDCCADACAGGCLDSMPGTTTKKSIYCVACAEINNDGKCAAVCPNGQSMNPDNGDIEVQDAKYQFARYCVAQCPDNVPRTGTYCKRYCEKGTFDYKDNTCTPCKGGTCDNICYGLGVDHGPLVNHTYIDASNIHNFNRNCTIIVGNLIFISSTLNGDSYCNVSKVSYEKIFDVFQNVEEITGYLTVEFWEWGDLCVFKNLKRIRGKQLKGQRFALTVYTDQPQLKQLCFNSLEQIDNGDVTFNHNRRLCLLDTVHWSDIFLHSSQDFNHVGKMRCKNVACHKTCVDGCWGPAATQCRKCLDYTDKTDASGQFTPKFVPDPQTGHDMPGYNVTTCVKECNISKGVYPSTDKQCIPCHEECLKTCHGKSEYNCTKCKNYNLDGKCVSQCPITHFTGPNKTCIACSGSCIDGGCKGPEDLLGVKGCTKCHKSFNEETNRHTFHGAHCQICLKHLKENECPEGCTTIDMKTDFQCYEPPRNNYTTVIVLCVLGVFILFVGIFFFFFCRHKTTIRRMKQTLGEKVVGDIPLADNEATPLTPSGMSPNQAQLRIVKENELAMGKLLGSGAFGAVHKAIWTPINIQGEKVKIAVAVKTLKTPGDVNPMANNEIMDEAYMMASVDCIYLVRLLGVCMTEHVSLITQLMPLGSLLEYVRNPKHQETIHAGHIVNWCTQIAKGMNYLAEKHLVHRDLAARNVLVKTPNHVKITDFGLAKILNAREDIYHAEGGKLPIKWLAIECITERTFSHLSDVWAFGVTCWELLTLGGRPYDGVRAVEMLSLLERGERLPQPASATIDIYMVLIKCWMVDRLCRPKFHDLVKEFTAMSKDPGRYVVMKTVAGSCITSPSPTDELQFFRQLLEEEKGEDGSVIADEPDQYLLRDALLNKRDNKYTPMSAVNSSSEIHASIHGRPEYENQPTVSNIQETTFMDGPRGHRLFSRNTPSAVFSTSLSSSSNGMGRIPEGEEPVSPIIDPDDVFAESGHSNKANIQAEETTVNRKDSEETQRYTEDPTTRKHLFDDTHTAPKKIPEASDSFNYDDDQYLMPTPSKKMPGPSLQSPSAAVANQAYVQANSLNHNPNPSSDYEQLSACKGGSAVAADAEYVNTNEGESLTPTWFENAEYMATDSGIGEDTQSLLSRGNTGNRVNRKTSTQSSFDETDELSLLHRQKNGIARPKNGPPQKHYTGDPMWSASSEESLNNPFQASIENPEYMGLVQAEVKQPNNSRTAMHTAI
uniref:receptor protein-tyrosine kinase n=1 Tax=Phallusia mammillata TaxID=59560 RepID=A0A6F9DC94_9ASCI|nr:EGFR1 epidermal growth factor receptor precursor [Phallusia mammillata]